MDDSGFRTYLEDHLTGAQTVVRMVAARIEDGQREPWLVQFHAELEEEIEILESLASRFASDSLPRQVMGWVAQKASRLKLTMDGLQNDALQSLIELEAMRTGVEGKLCLWRSLNAVQDDPRVAPVPVDRLLEQGRAQAVELERHRLAAVRQLAASEG